MPAAPVQAQAQVQPQEGLQEEVVQNVAEVAVDHDDYTAAGGVDEVEGSALDASYPHQEEEVHHAYLEEGNTNLQHL